MNSNIKKNVSIIMIIIFFIGFLFGFYKILSWKKDNDESKNINDSLKNSIDIETYGNEVKYNINFNKLKSINSDTVGYLIVNNTGINYVVVKGKDNKYYLNHDFYKNKNEAGWIYTDYRNKVDGSDKNLVVFGHNMSTGIMFGTLKKTQNPDWYMNKDNRIIKLIVENKTYNYEVFSLYTIRKEAYYINTEFSSDSTYYEFLKKIQSRSIYDFNVELSKNDKIITLSTCNTGGTYRTVLHAKLID